ncbi:hypothetical protein DFJ77DRAFT_495618 [Powellomyces hirtus]|nr:hypothetical protein DFJ77DRAFT_495618 [Powellomyces hirtus]
MHDHSVKAMLYDVATGLGTFKQDDPDLKIKAGIIVPLATFFSVGVLCILVFCIVRSFFRDIYAPRRALAGGRPPKLPSGLLAWVPALLRMPEPLLVTQVGLDGVVLLRFFKMGAHLFTVLSFFGLSVIAPVNYFANPPRYNNSTGILYEDVLIPALTVENVPKQSHSLWVHLFFTWFFSLIAYAYLIAYYRGIVDLKTHYVEHVLRRTHMSKIEIRSIIVFGIPRELRHEVDLASYFEGLGIGKVENVVLCRKWSHLRNAVQKRAYYLTQLEKIYANVMRNARRYPNRAGLPLFRDGSSSSLHSGGHISSGNGFERGNGLNIIGNLSRTALADIGEAGNESDEYDDLDQASRPLLSVPRRFSTSSDPGDGSLFELMSRLDAVDPRNRPKHRTGFMGLRGPLVDSAGYYAEKFQEWDRKVARLRKNPESSAATSAGFVTFESPESAILASQVLLHRRPFACMARQAPEPRDVFWVNLSSKVADSYIKMFRSVAVAATLFVLVFFSTIVVSGITALISLDTFPKLQSFLKHLGPGWVQFIQGVIPAVVTAAWTSSLPAVLILLAQAQGLEAQSWIDASVLSKYFFYQIWNILFVQTVAHQIWERGSEIIRLGPGEIIDMLGRSVPRAAPAQINYVMLQATAVYPAQLLLVGPLIITWITRLASWSRSTPRQVSDAYYPSVLTSINYGLAYPGPILVFCVGITYAPVAPLILPFCTLFFAIAWFVYKYLLLYVNIPRYETGGKHAPMAIRRCLAGIFIMQLTMMGVLALKAGSGINGHPDDDERSMRSDDKSKLHWSGYVQMVVGVAPLLIITGLIFWWFKHGFEKLLDHVPLDVVGSVARELASQRTESGTARDGVMVGETEHGKELAPVRSPRSSVHRHSATVSKRVSIKAIRGRVRKASTATADGRPSGLVEETEELLSRAGSTTTPSTPDGAYGSLSSSPSRFEMAHDGPSGSRERDAGRPDDFYFQAVPEDAEDGRRSSSADESQALVNDLLYEEAVTDLDNSDEVIHTQHLEPPMTRVPGVLDAPFITASAIVPAGDEEEQEIGAFGGDDLQIHTYVHPALIGRLPVPWVPGAIQPRRCREAREEMSRGQRGLYDRIVGRQRVGVWELGGSGEARTNGNEGSVTRDGAFARRNSATVARKVMSFVDGVTAWAHLSMS